MKCRISVAMASYNGALYLEEQLVSILEQTRQVDEIIVYDDGSSDATYAILENFVNAGANIKLFAQEKRVGYVKNFASALKETTGELIFLSDQDDIWEKNKVECMASLFEHDDQIACVASGFTFIDRKGVTITKEDIGNNHGLSWNRYAPDQVYAIDSHELLFHNIAMGCTMALRSSIKDEYLQKSSLVSAHDWEILFLAALKQGARFYNHSFLRYRIHDTNTAGNDKMHKKAHVYDPSRKKNAKSLLVCTQAFMQYVQDMDVSQKETLQTLHEFHEKRLHVLEDGHVLTWFSLLKNYVIYKKITSKKGMIADFLYAIHK